LRLTPPDILTSSPIPNGTKQLLSTSLGWSPKLVQRIGRNRRSGDLRIGEVRFEADRPVGTRGLVTTGTEAIGVEHRPGRFDAIEPSKNLGILGNPGATTTRLPTVSQISASTERWAGASTLGKSGKCASGSPRIDNRLVHLDRQRFDALGERLHCFRELSILPEHFYEEGSLIRGKRRSLLACAVQSLAMFRIGEGMSRVAVGLAGLR
jgi:hypothetical protein